MIEDDGVGMILTKMADSPAMELLVMPMMKSEGLMLVIIPVL